MLCWKCHSSSSSLCHPQSSPYPQAIRATRPINSLYSRWYRIRRSRSPFAAKHPIRTSNSDPLRACTVYRRRPGHRRGAVLRRQITVLSSKAAVAATSSQLHISSLCRIELPQCQYSVGLCRPTIWPMGKSERLPFIPRQKHVATVIQRFVVPRAAVCIDRQLDAYPRSLPIAAVRPVQHHAALCLTRRPLLHRRHRAYFRRSCYSRRRLLTNVVGQQSTILDKCCLCVNLVSVIVLHIDYI